MIVTTCHYSPLALKSGYSDYIKICSKLSTDKKQKYASLLSVTFKDHKEDPVMMPAGTQDI
jgi:hypothetical protein